MVLDEELVQLPSELHRNHLLLQLFENLHVRGVGKVRFLERSGVHNDISVDAHRQLIGCYVNLILRVTAAETPQTAM